MAKYKVVGVSQEGTLSITSPIRQSISPFIILNVLDRELVELGSQSPITTAVLIGGEIMQNLDDPNPHKVSTFRYKTLKNLKVTSLLLIREDLNKDQVLSSPISRTFYVI